MMQYGISGWRFLFGFIIGGLLLVAWLGLPLWVWFVIIIVGFVLYAFVGPIEQIKKQQEEAELRKRQLDQLRKEQDRPEAPS